MITRRNDDASGPSSSTDAVHEGVSEQSAEVDNIREAVAETVLLLANQDAPGRGAAAVLRALHLHTLELPAVRKRWGWQTERDIAEILLRPEVREHVGSAGRALSRLLAEREPVPERYFAWRLARESDGTLAMDDTRPQTRSKLDAAKTRALDGVLVEAIVAQDAARILELWRERDALWSGAV